MSWIRVSLFGEVAWRPTGEVQFRLESAKAQELLVCLLLRRGRRVSRDTLAGMIWADQPNSRARQYLRKCLWQLQSALAATGVPEAASLLVTSDDEIAVQHGDSVWVDALAFESCCGITRGTRGPDMDPRIADDLMSAVELYRGDLLEGWYHDWCVVERERYEVMYVSALDKLIGYAEAHRDYEAGIDYCRTVLTRDPAREYTHRALMRLLAAAGDRTGALRQFQRCATVLREELDVAPSARTVALRDRIREAGDDPFDPEPTVDSPDGSRLVSTLRRLQEALQAAQHEVTREIDELTSKRRR